MQDISIHKSPKRTRALAVVVFVAFFIGAGALVYTNAQQGLRITALEEDLERSILQNASTTAMLTADINDLEVRLVQLSDRFYNKERDWEEIEEEFEDINDTVEGLEKLSNTDRQLLQKYSKVYFLNEHYTPRALRQIDNDYLYNGKRPERVLEEVEPFLEDLIEDAERDDIDLKIVSAYRSFDTQGEIKSQYTVTYGSGANTFSADQGYSEHQLGTAVDFSTEAIDGALDERFAETEEYKWLQKNAHKHGFVLSYPPNNDYYVFEPWHWRFVGEDLARDLEDDGEYFYDLEQREIDEYLGVLFD